MGEAPSEDLGRKVGSTLPTQWTLRNNPGVRYGQDRCWYVFTAAFAPYGEVADPHLGQLPHEDIIGEQKANICTDASFREIPAYLRTSLTLYAT